MADPAQSARSLTPPNDVRSVQEVGFTIDSVTLSRADVQQLLGLLLLWVHDSILRQSDNDALIRRVGAAMGRPC